MKFGYDGKTDERECVAFIDDDGDLCVKSNDSDIGAYVGIPYATDEKFQEYMHINGVTKKFYPGDKLTITF